MTGSRWTEVGSITLSELHQIQKGKYHMFSFYVKFRLQGKGQGWKDGLVYKISVAHEIRNSLSSIHIQTGCSGTHM